MVLVLIACSLLLGFRAVVVWRRQGEDLAAKLEIGRRGEMVLRDLLERLGYRSRADGVHVGEGARSAELDTVLSGEGFLLVLEAKNWGGTVLGSRSDDTWWVVDGKGDRWPRRNPINQAARQARLLGKEAGVPTTYCCVMLGRSSPPPGGTFPDGVISVRDLPGALPRLLEVHPKRKRGDAAVVEQAFQALVARSQAASGRDRAAAHREKMAAMFTPMPWVVPLAISVLCSCAAGYIEDGSVRETLDFLGALLGAR